ncbi:MAG: hypothetical protein Q9207_005924 [Kuettlingeria erythrocarpa]
MPFVSSQPQSKAIAMQHALAITKTYRGRSWLWTTASIMNDYVAITAYVLLSLSASRASFISPALARLVYVLSTLLIASRLRALENLVHEASHNNLFPSTPLHERLQFLYAYPVFRLVQDYRRSHLIHHKHLGDRSKDPDIIRLYGLGLDNLPDKPFWYLCGLPMTGYLTYEYLTTTFWEFWASSSSRASKTVFWMLISVAVANMHACQNFAYYYLVPFFIILPVTRYWAEVSEHLGLDLQGDFGGSRTNVGFLHRWYLNPHNDGYHAVHHLCSQVPFYLLPQAHASLVNGSDQFARWSAISHGVWETIRQMKESETILKGADGRLAH